MNEISVVGLDLAKNVIQVHAVDEAGLVVLRKTLKRSDVSRFFARLKPCLIGMEACGGAHYWTRVLTGFGHTVRMMAPAFVKPYLKSNKNDRNDAEAICEAVQRPSMRFVTPKTPEQQAVLHLHHARQQLVRQRVALSNHMRGVLGDGKGFRNGRQFAAWLGLVPKQSSSGGKERLLGISKRGDGYLRTLLIHGARAVIHHVRRRLKGGMPGGHPWVEELLTRCHVNEVAVALANKMARVAWTLKTAARPGNTALFS